MWPGGGSREEVGSPRSQSPLCREKQEAMQASGGAQAGPWVVEAGVGAGYCPGV